jgi:hypothetical protein
MPHRSARSTTGSPKRLHRSRPPLRAIDSNQHTARNRPALQARIDACAAGGTCLGATCWPFVEASKYRNCTTQTRRGSTIPHRQTHVALGTLGTPTCGLTEVDMSTESKVQFDARPCLGRSDRIFGCLRTGYCGEESSATTRLRARFGPLSWTTAYGSLPRSAPISAIRAC